MWHPIPFVAESRRLDADALTAFAMANQDKYGIAIDSGRPEVNTWHVDKMVADFKAAHAEKTTCVLCSGSGSISPARRCICTY